MRALLKLSTYTEVKKTKIILYGKQIDIFNKFPDTKSGYGPYIARCKVYSSVPQVVHDQTCYMLYFSFLLAMRERYQKHGGMYELSKETKNQLGLTEPSHWTLEKLISIQNTMTEPLVLYW